MKKCSKILCFIYRTKRWGQVKVDKDATDGGGDERKDEVVRNDEKEEKQEMETSATHRSYIIKRVCRHMRLTESALTCPICEMVRRFFHVNGNTYIYIIFSNLLDDGSLNISE